MAKRKTADEWASIEAEYRAGDRSLREIAEEHGISDTAIRKHAKARGWVREVRGCEPERRAAESAPADIGDVTERARQLAARMMDELDAATSNLGELEAIIEVEMRDASFKRREAAFRAISLAGRAAVLKTLSAALKALDEKSAPVGKRAAAQDKANEINNRFRPIGPPTLKAVK